MKNKPLIIGTIIAVAGEVAGLIYFEYSIPKIILSIEIVVAYAAYIALLKTLRNRCK